MEIALLVRHPDPVAICLFGRFQAPQPPVERSEVKIGPHVIGTISDEALKSSKGLSLVAGPQILESESESRERISGVLL